MSHVKAKIKRPVPRKKKVNEVFLLIDYRLLNKTTFSGGKRS